MTQVLANGLSNSSVIVLVALGFGVIYYTTRHLHVAHGATYLLGGYIGYGALTFGGFGPVTAGLLAMLGGAGYGCLLEWLLYGPLARRGGRPEVVLIASLGAYILTINGVAAVAGSEAKYLRLGPDDVLRAGGVSLAYIQVVQLALAACVVFAFAVLLRRTALGRNWQAVSDDPSLAAVLGINLSNARLTAFAAGSALAALAGYVRALDVGVDPNVGFPAVLQAAIACIVGGVGVFLGPALGAFALGVPQAIGTWFTSAQWEPVFSSTVLLLALIFRPQGLLGVRRQTEES